MRSRRAAAAALLALLLLALWLLWPRGAEPGAVPPPAPPPSPPQAPRPPEAVPTAEPAPATPTAAPAPDPRPYESLDADLFRTVLVAPPGTRLVTLEGVVLGIRGEPVPQATVVLTIPSDKGADATRPLRESVDGIFDLTTAGWATTGADGKFRLVVSPVPRAGLIAWGGGHANTLLDGLSLLEDVRGVVLRFEPAAAIAGRVLRLRPAEDGSPVPVAEAAVTLMRKADGGERWIAMHTTHTDEEGRFRDWGWSPGEFALAVEAAGFGRQVRTPVRLPGEEQEFRLVESATGRLDGFVTLADGTTPAGGATVRATTYFPLSHGGPSEAGTTTDAEGRFAFEAVEVAPAGSATMLRIEADGGERGIGFRTVERWTGETTEAIALDGAGAPAIRGRLVDARDGGEARVPGGVALVLRGSVRDAFGPASVVQQECRADAEGAFEVPRFPGRGARLVLSPVETEWEFARGEAVPLPEPRPDAPWQVEVLPRGSVAGVVYLPDGTPAAGARVEAFPPGTAPGAAVCGEGGRFVLRGVRTRDFRRGVVVDREIVLQASLDGYQPGRSSTLTLHAGDAVEGVAVSIPLALKALSGRVVDGDGHPVLGAVVVGVPQEGTTAPATTVTGPTGHYRLEAAPLARWRIRAAHPGCLPAESEAVLPGDPIPDLVLAPAERK